MNPITILYIYLIGCVVYFLGSLYYSYAMAKELYELDKHIRKSDMHNSHIRWLEDAFPLWLSTFVWPFILGLATVAVFLIYIVGPIIKWVVNVFFKKIFDKLTQEK